MAEQFKLTTPLGDDALIFHRMVGEESLGRPFQYDLTLLSEDQEIDPKAILGKPASLTYTAPDGAERVFHGRVAGFGYIGAMEDKIVYRMVLKPWIWFLGTFANCCIFQEMKIPDIITKVFRDAGFTDFKDQLSGTYSALDYVVQYNETSLDFVHRLMERVGIYYYFEHTSSKHTVVLTDSPTPHPDSGSVVFQEVSENQPVENRITRWTSAFTPQPGSVSFESYTFTQPKTELLSKVSQPAGHDLDGGAVYLYNGLYDASGDGETLARVELEAYAAGWSRRTGSGTAAALELGRTFSLERHPRQKENADFLIIAARYTLEGGGTRSGNDSGGKIAFTCDFETIEKGTKFRLQKETRQPRIAGPQTAVVVGKSGEEIWTDKYGRVRLQFHWDQEGKSDENSSCWVRVAQMWSGAQWGGQIIPRIGQEVVVDFINGDPDQPLVTGCVYNDTNQFPYTLPTNATQSGIKSRSSKGGGGWNEFRFEDKKDSEEVYLHAQKDLNSDILNDETRTIGNDRTTTITGNETFTIDKDRTGTIKGNDTLSVTKDRKTTISGNMTIAVTGDQTESVDGNDTQTVGGDRKATVSGDETLSVSGKISVDAGGNITISSGGSISMDASSKITLSVGSSSIELTSSGVSISGTTVEASANGTATLKSSGTLTVQGAQSTVKGTMLTVQGDAMTTVKGGVVMIN